MPENREDEPGHPFYGGRTQMPVTTFAALPGSYYAVDIEGDEGEEGMVGVWMSLHNALVREKGVMRVKGVDPAALTAIAASLGLRLENERPAGHYHAFTLRLARSVAEDRATAGDAAFRLDARGRRAPSYRKLGLGGHFTPGAVCFHGHAEFMARLFRRFPEATLRTREIAYRGRADYLAKWRGVGARNVGSLMSPLCYEDACHCGKAFPAAPGRRLSDGGRP